MKQHKIIREEKEIVNIGAKAPMLYDDVPLTTLTAYSLYWLHQWHLPRTIESIAVLNWRLFPEKFAMVGFKEFPDAFRTNRSLLQMQPKYRNLLTGAAVKGFSLNAHGMEKAAELCAKLGVPTTTTGDTLGEPIEKSDARKHKPHQARSVEPEQDVERIKSSKLFDKWKKEAMSERDLIHAHGLLGIFDHTPSAVRARAMKDLERAADKLEDHDARRFLSEVRKTFPQLLREGR